MKYRTCILSLGLFLGSSSIVLALSDENRPEYQKEYDAYLRDLNVIAELGKAPDNPNLMADLAKMSSNEKIMLTAPQKKDSSNLSLAQSDDAQIMNSVELIRVPEEFREEYHDVYKEEKKMISTQSLAESDNARKKDIVENSKILDISDHVNPFRFLAEVPLSPLKKDKEQVSEAANPLVGAYFNQFGRPYVPESANQKNSTKENPAARPAKPLGQIGIRNSMIVD